MKASYDKENAERYLGAAVIAYHGALREVVKALATAKGTADLSWFDELHQNAIRSAKGTITEQIPVEVEAGAIRFGFETIDAEFKSIRVSLIKNQDG
ncbi:hypothetical protein HGO34_08055 [Agrobacterium vitis]|uniref:Uncharacterized protein n=1 Tax=Agrobacterium vitis TaxID=373 RepID=A0AAE4WBC4_AGRVI|nr:hypothetical protein [Agrobacterium vitis]MCF1502026.1 hypothetical protein [Allorhizobium sp. Av2]MCM2439667.1 hypothetical protein [Agrobacterium vitis]MUZ57436.1 hypothetical protein [Agrobacterium vitis]MVA69300.1 hypothetical protein [Agrobacterium vitis]MVA86770.1 hypothetical protein [Agrobacterium vitis]